MASVLTRTTVFWRGMFPDGSKGAGKGKAHADIGLIIPFHVSMTTCYNEAEKGTSHPL